METYHLITKENTISSTNANVSFSITCSDYNSETLLKFIEVDLTSLADIVDWQGVTPQIITTRTPAPLCRIGPSRGLQTGQILFTFLDDETYFKDYNNEITFVIPNLYKLEGQSFPPTAPITFKLKTPGNTVIGNPETDYTYNAIQVANKKPVINSCRINPSIVQDSTYIAISYETTDAVICELVDGTGQSFDTQTNIDPSKSFRYTRQFKPAKPGTFPCPPFHLYARDGARESVASTVREVTVCEDAKWTKLDNFSRRVPVINEDGTVIYQLEQYTVLDLILNERDDMMWAIMQKGDDFSTLADTPPCLWKSSDGITWMPHTNSFQNKTRDILSTDVTIPAELVHCPCVHFGTEELYFIGGSKADISVCVNTVSVLNLRLNTIDSSRYRFPPAMKPRSLHACVIYPDAAGNDNIWVIGGADKNGNGLNDVWRFDGTTWIAVPTGDASFPKRCRFAATVQTDVHGKKSIWIGGGATRYNGSTLNDLWLYDGTKWVKAQDETGNADLNYSEEWLAAASLCYIRTRLNSVPDPVSDTYRYILSSDLRGNSKQLVCSWIVGVDLQDHDYRWSLVTDTDRPQFPAVFANVRNFTAATIGFNGCAWTVILAYISKGNVVVSNLYYSCPMP
ncbi:Kelch repeat-containing protein [Chitinophaga rhizophila]|uniref:Galactose oxidase-like protein n=1 Tax=Chitinophaga rhizophila TaxID=2866212 RepID=A0ABS7G5W3_9BACT|nr:kelch repeat-containing protein [Chitinophaga rhizophila]MBW8683017.1 hypothetical protein [Chitinophaga rhizophila]